MDEVSWDRYDPYNRGNNGAVGIRITPAQEKLVANLERINYITGPDATPIGRFQVIVHFQADKRIE